MNYVKHKLVPTGLSNSDRIQEQQEREKRLINLFNMKKNCVQRILVLKSAFSLIDQMFQKEMTNVEYLKKNWCRQFFMPQEYQNIVKPTELNAFVEELMDPFK